MHDENQQSNKVKKTPSNTRVLGIKDIPVVQFSIGSNNSLPANKDPVISLHQSWGHDKDDEDHDCSKLSPSPPAKQTDKEWNDAVKRGREVLLRKVVELHKAQKQK